VYLSVTCEAKKEEHLFFIYLLRLDNRIKTTKFNSMKKLYNYSKNRFDEMQKILTALLLSITFCYATQAQNHKITFSGIGESTTVDSIRILNVTQETSISLLESETLNLVQNISGISELDANENFLAVYPNPMTQNAKLKFVNTKSGEVMVQIFDLAGKLVAINKQTLKAGKYIYQISGIKSGTYLVKIQMPDKECSAKLISTNGSNSIPEIHQLTTNTITNLKSATIEDLVQMQYNEGDSLLFIGYSGDYLIDTVGIVLTADANIVFDFVPPSVDIHLLLAKSYQDFKSYIEYSFVFDAAYSNKIEFSNDSTWSIIASHTQNSTDSNVDTLWSNAYNIIYSVNSVIANAQLINNEAEKQLIIAQAKCIRATLYYTLVKWFGEIPLDSQVINDTIPWFSVNNHPRSTVNDVYTQIIFDLGHSIDYLPQNIAQSENIKLNKYFAASIKARTLIIQQKWDELKAVTSQIINSGNYALTVDPDNFLSASPENIFGFDEVNNYHFNEYYNWQYVPAMRYTEILLMSIEANYQLGDRATATAYLNILVARRNLPSISPEITLNDIYNQWKTELKLEGCTFSYYKRFNKIQEELGIDQSKYLLPIPSRAFNFNSYLTQNAGY